MIRLILQIISLLLMLAISSYAYAQHQGAEYYNEAYIDSPGHVVGELNVVRPQGMGDPLIYTFQQDGGAFDIYQQSTGQKILHGRVHADGQIETKPPSIPKPPRRPGVGRVSLTCSIAEVGARLECSLLCGSAGVHSVVGGICGVASKCYCNAPPPPPPNPTPVPGAGFLAPWMTINDFWGTAGGCGMAVCDHDDPF